MLPPGHFAAGYLTAKIAISSLHYNLSPHQVSELTWIGALIGFMPDLDFFVAFAKTKSLRIENDKIIHRTFPTHFPLFWLVIGLIVFFGSSAPFYKTLGLLIWFCTWSHFILDSEWGIKWFWPLSKKFYPFSEAFYVRKYSEAKPAAKNFFKYWFEIAWNYYASPQGLLEILIILIAIIKA